jgi:hypothetical protein
MTIRQCVVYSNDLSYCFLDSIYLICGCMTIRWCVAITVRDTPPYGPAPTFQISLTYLERQTNYGRDKNILLKKQLFDLEVKGHYSMRHTTLWSCTHISNKYYLKNNTKGHYCTQHTALWSYTPILWPGQENTM